VLVVHWPAVLQCLQLRTAVRLLLHRPALLGLLFLLLLLLLCWQSGLLQEQGHVLLVVLRG
jgi:hypothetical protein